MTDSSHRVAPVEDSLDVLREVARQQDSDQSSASTSKSPQRSWEDELILAVVTSRGLTLLGPEHELYKFGRFEAIAFRGEGGFGIVFEVRDPELDRHVALKLCRRREPGAAADIIREARLLAKISHPNVVSIHETGIHEGDAFFVMEYVEKCRTANEFAFQKPRPSWEEIVDLYRGAAAGLAAAHAAGIVHNDFKPGNILIDQDDWPRVADFGLAQIMLRHTTEAEREEYRRRGGTLPYTAPEVLLGFPGEELSDQWSFCAALWHSLDGAPPYEGGTSIELLETMDQDEPEFMNSALPKALREVLRVGLSLEPHERYPDMQALRKALDEVRQPRPARLRWMVLIGVVLLLVGLVTGRLISAPSGGAFVGHVAAMTAGQRAVALARAGDADGAVQLLEDARQQASKSQVRMLAVASQEVAVELEEHGEWHDAIRGWALSILLALEADDPALERIGHQGVYEAHQHELTATAPSR